MLSSELRAAADELIGRYPLARSAFTDGQTVTVTGPGDGMILRARVTAAVRVGRVALRRNSTHRPVACLATPGAPVTRPLRVRLDPHLGETASDRSAATLAAREARRP